MKTHMACEVPARHPLNGIISMARALPCGCYEMLLLFGSRFANVLLIHLFSVMSIL